MRVLVVIPARLESSRFPNKPLALIDGRAMILMVLDALPDYEKIVATPNPEIVSVVEEAGYKAFLTQREAVCGTDRLVEVAEAIEADLYVNVQGDEPLIQQHTIDKLVNAKLYYREKVVCAMTHLDSSPDCVKVLVSGGSPTLSRKLYKQVGIYVFNRADLREFGRPGEIKESIEMTKFSSNRLHFVEVDDTQAVDRPEDIKKVERILCQKK